MEGVGTLEQGCCSTQGGFGHFIISTKALSHGCSPPPAFWLLEPGPSPAQPPRAAQCVIFYQESIVSASVLQSAFRRVCSPSWAALINLVCEAVSSALVNVRDYLPESLLLNLDKSRGKRKSPIKGKALKPPAGAATADAEGLDTMSGPLTARAAPSPLVYYPICKGFHPNVRPECRTGSSRAVAAGVEVSLPEEKCSSVGLGHTRRL